MDPTVASVLQAALSLSPQDRFHILNSLSLVGDDDFTGSDLGLQINAISFASPPSNSPALFPAYAPSLLSVPVSRSASPSGICTPSQVTLLNIAALSDELPRPSLPAIIDLTLDDIDNAADALLFASPSPSLVPAPLPPPILPSLSPPALLSLPVVMEDNDLIEGVKTFKTSVFILEVASPNPSLTYYPPIFLPRAFEQPRDPDELAPVTLVTRGQSTTHTTTQNTRQQDSPRPPDVGEVAWHAMKRTPRHRPKSRKSSGQKNNQQNDTRTVDLTTPHALRRCQHVQFSNDRNRHTRLEQEETAEVVATSPRNDARAALQNRIDAWRTQIMPKQTT
ncbi:hypothetical protein EDB85DRAFT_2150822 [Lactarius pseudohatsudake]|nr:hypothetical protein EDB85DRAFT_2150822 [Lactarius pseudohatsudake]